MRARTAAVAIACLLAGAMPASGAEPVATDPCGDVLLRASAGGEVVSAPDPRERPLDIQALSFESVFESADGGEPVFKGVDVSLHLCTPAKFPAVGEGFTVSWDVATPPGEQGDCREYVTLFRGLVLGTETYLAARYEHACAPPDALPGHYSALYAQDLGYLGMVRGNTITWELRVDRLQPEMSGSVAAGQVWTSPWAQTRGTQASGRTSTVEAGGGSATAGTLADEAGPGSDFTVGSS